MVGVSKEDWLPSNFVVYMQFDMLVLQELGLIQHSLNLCWHRSNQHMPNLCWTLLLKPRDVSVPSSSSTMVKGGQELGTDSRTDPKILVGQSPNLQLKALEFETNITTLSQ